MSKITLKELHEINNKYPHKKNIHQTYIYDVAKNEWVFKGYKCIQCGKTFKKLGVIENHDKSCYPDRKLANKEPIDCRIRTVRGDSWQPFDTNQKFSAENTKTGTTK